MATLSLCMIVKDEEDSLENCLMSVFPFVDEIVIVDTGSKDSTLEVARKYTDKIYQISWEDDFSKARNVSLRHATGDWIFVLDADEELDKRSGERIKEIMKDEEKAAYYVQVRNKMPQALSKPIRLMRLFVNDERIFYSGYIHENIEKSLNQYLMDTQKEVGQAKICINHYGYLEKFIKKGNKLKRNRNILMKQVSEDRQNCYSWLRLGEIYRWEQDCEKALTCLQEAYKLVRKFKEANKSIASSVYCQYGSVLIQLGKYEKAYQICCEGLEKFQVPASLLYTKAIAAQKKGLLIEALGDFKQCLNLSPVNSDILTDDVGASSYHALNSIGEIYAIQKENQKASEYYQKAIDLAPGYSPARHNLSKIYIAEGRLDEAIDQYKEILEYDNSDITAWISGGMVCFWQNELAKAKIWFDKARSINFELSEKILEPYKNFFLKNRANAPINKKESNELPRSKLVGYQ